MPTSVNIPNYEILRALGRGNTSVVCLARDAQGREVALKVPSPTTLGDPAAAARFGNEVRLSLQLKHPHLIKAYGGTAFGTQAHLALHYYPHGALSDQLEAQEGRALSRKEAMRILADIASALRFLHESGAVHQDVKPQNVYVDGEGRAALGDLGSAYFTAQGSQTSGSPFYMAPEVYRGDATTPASDVYSLGIMMYELLGGERPFKGESYDALMVAHLNSFAEPLSQLAPSVPRSVARMAEKALAKRASDRPTAEAIEQVLLVALGEKVVTPEADPAPAPAPAPSVVTGRHAAAEPSREKEKDHKEKGGFSWNPFKRKK